MIRKVKNNVGARHYHFDRWVENHYPAGPVFSVSWVLLLIVLSHLYVRFLYG